jgi:DNA-binding response OmpR family regulator
MFPHNPASMLQDPDLNGPMGVEGQGSPKEATTATVGAAKAVSAPRAGEDARPVVERPLRVALLDRDSGFVVVLTRRLKDVAWEYSSFGSAMLPARLVAMNFDAVVVDIELLGADAWRWLEAVGGAADQPAIVVCTAGSTVDDRVRALRLGVDDWLAKPCHPEELIARVETVVRQRRRLLEGEDSCLIGELEIKRDVYQAFVGGESLRLTRREYNVLTVLAAGLGKVVSRESVYEQVWGAPMPRDERSVDVVVHKLRRKLQSASPLWQYIHTHPTVGYRFAASSCEPSTRREQPTRDDRRKGSK